MDWNYFFRWIESPVKFGFLVFIIVLFRYILFAGIAHLVIWKKKYFSRFRIQADFPDKTIMRYEFLNSLHTFVYFGLNASLISYLYTKGFTQIYLDEDKYSSGYFSLSILLALIIHDTYFYWAHRFMHIRRLFPYFHKVHHKSVNPSPWASFSFHPLESLVEAGILPLLVLVIPVHPMALGIFLAIMTLLNVEGHLGYEFYPKGFTKHPIWRIFNTSTHHNMHHKFFNCNYGLYFNWWDRIMKTNHPKYHEFFDELKSR